MAKFQLTAADLNNLIVKKEGSETELKKFTIASTSSGAILCCSDGSLIRILNDSGVIEFYPIVLGSATVSITPANVVDASHGTMEIEGEIKWMTFMNYPQRLIITQESPE